MCSLGLQPHPENVLCVCIVEMCSLGLSHILGQSACDYDFLACVARFGVTSGTRKSVTQLVGRREAWRGGMRVK